MKAKLTDRPFDDPAWVFERKLDGIRAAVRRDGGEVTLTSRTGKTLSPAYPELVEALEAEPATEFAADGEIVAFEGPRTSFERLQGRMGIHDPRLARLSGIPVYLYLFDLLEFDGHDLTGLPLRQRKRHCAAPSPSTARSATRPTATSTARTSSPRPARRAGRG